MWMMDSYGIEDVNQENLENHKEEEMKNNGFHWEASPFIILNLINYTLLLS